MNDRQGRFAPLASGTPARTLSPAPSSIVRRAFRPGSAAVIHMKQPSLVLHSYDVPGYEYQMQWTWKMPRNASAHDVLYWILYAADHSKEMGLENVIINCHAGPGFLAVGGRSSGFGIESAGLFSQLRDNDIGTIWLVGCDVAAVEKGPGGRNGKHFCSELAKASGSEVIAADVEQYVELGYYLHFSHYGAIDDFEGVAYRFKPEGGYTWYSW
jgi:hypothetical protein